MYKIMKKRFLVTLLALTLFFLTNAFCIKICFAADNEYGRVLDDNVIFYSKNLSNEYTPLFCLAKSYYVLILDSTSSDEYYLCQCQDSTNNYKNIIGYVKKSDLTIWENPSSPYYPDITATVVNSTSLYDNPFDLNEKFYIPQGNQYKVYGSLKNQDQELYYYIIIHNDLDGYIPAEMLDITAPVLHPDPMPTPTPTPTTQPTASPTINPSNNINNLENTDSKDSLLQILLISAICIPALIIVYLMFKPAKRVNHNYKNYYDDEDDE